MSNAAGSSPGDTSSQASLTETGSPGLALAEYAAIAVAPLAFRR